MNWMLRWTGSKARRNIWSARSTAYSRSRRAIPAAARRAPAGDVLLVEGNNHISGVIKYLTQSTWSHAALYVGPIGERTTADGEPLVLVEAILGEAWSARRCRNISAIHTRICRPIG
jgi:hypothetical protein